MSLPTTPPLIPNSSCIFCSAPMLRHHLELPIWRCSADDWHRLWLSHERKADGKKGKVIGVWLGRSRQDPGSGPGPVPEWVK
jgi:hypothetical protein